MVGASACRALAVAAACFSVALASLQTARTRRTVAISAAAYAVLYVIMRSSTFLQPAAGTISAKEAAEWRARVISTVNAILISYGAAQCYSEWSDFNPASEGWVLASREAVQLSSVNLYGAMLIGYLSWDLCWVVWHHHATPDISGAVHHILFLSIAHYNMWGSYVLKAYAWTSAAEVSTPFLNARWFLATLSRKEARRGES